YPQPLHIFHQQQIPSQSIQLTQPKKHHTITTLHPQQPPFLHTHILITNPKHPIPLPPLIPPHFSQLTQQTTHLLLQPPIFHPLSIPHTSHPLNLTSESSSPFQKAIPT
ncbi:phenylalanine--tRNA ligase beta subunit-related protein, partial [Staphylococcus epidermidis]|uniref:phenylalanine--tRNA ligase beta subunit-related protein n=1 Tax=Staphylococcus epidermidis TaxID=1282 RepID=UPI0021B399C6